jgi:hypothetical protein
MVSQEVFKWCHFDPFASVILSVARHLSIFASAYVKTTADRQGRPFDPLRAGSGRNLVLVGKKLIK